MPNKITIPRYGTDYITDIIESENLSLDEKTNDIYHYDVYMLRKSKKGGMSMSPLYNKREIKNALIELMR